jgi:hypothetical protein
VNKQAASKVPQPTNKLVLDPVSLQLSIAVSCFCWLCPWLRFARRILSPSSCCSPSNPHSSSGRREHQRVDGNGRRRRRRATAPGSRAKLQPILPLLPADGNVRMDWDARSRFSEAPSSPSILLPVSKKAGQGRRPTGSTPFCVLYTRPSPFFVPPNSFAPPWLCPALIPPSSHPRAPPSLTQPSSSPEQQKPLVIPNLASLLLTD